MRYDPSTGIYRDCRWCNGRGCVSCKIEADKEYKRQFPDGPKPIATFSIEDIESGKARDVLGPEAIDSAAVEARRLAIEKIVSFGGGHGLLNITDKEAVDALTGQLIGKVLEEIIKTSQRGTGK